MQQNGICMSLQQNVGWCAVLSMRFCVALQNGSTKKVSEVVFVTGTYVSMDASSQPSASRKRRRQEEQESEVGSMGNDGKRVAYRVACRVACRVA